MFKIRMTSESVFSRECPLRQSLKPEVGRWLVVQLWVLRTLTGAFLNSSLSPKGEHQGNGLKENEGLGSVYFTHPGVCQISLFSMKGIGEKNHK